VKNTGCEAHYSFLHDPSSLLGPNILNILFSKSLSEKCGNSPLRQVDMSKLETDTTQTQVQIVTATPACSVSWLFAG
jgi:hypothetical protein